ncbi:hypothetical protein [Sphingomonas parapaucimobilis]|uniref:Uncharacterized protein n=1 Tax=Sphingomonas parapaucimobilis NBRC 15100 TaxID=1219049 RepID=A0A0A1W802_9SPHN|nr:hypothetical protein [Sphingomonas parapaucimobilis]GAM01590.1 hypothetical protein SP5_067_00030 [Sphingomonas parapaucimobilis NBRC 15100]
MRQTSNSIAETAPLLFRHATPCIASEEMSGRYDPEVQLWVVNTGKGFVPLVEAASVPQLETRTCTRVQQEGDDEDAAASRELCSTLLDTSTFTKTKQEGADDDISTDDGLVGVRSCGALEAIVTRTNVQQEGTDEMASSALLDLETRSLNNQEGIDDDWPLMLLELQTRSYSNGESDDEDSLVH